MSKAILIIDMPINCNNCPCFDCGDDRCCCNVLNIDLCNEDTTIIYKDCPLKPIPSKKEITVEMMWNSKYEAESLYYAGFNACLDEITEEEE